MTGQAISRIGCPGRSRCRGGTATDIVFGIMILGLLGAGVWWIIKTMGQAGRQYTQGMIHARQEATSVRCQMNMRAVWQLLQTQVAVEGQYPRSRQDLEQLCGDARLLRCPDPNGGDYVYLPPGRTDDPAVRMVLCDPLPVHQGMCCVLLSDGQLGMLTPEQVKGTSPQKR